MRPLFLAKDAVLVASSQVACSVNDGCPRIIAENGKLAARSALWPDASTLAYIYPWAAFHSRLRYTAN